jgi:diketogulonate reductase-like aldo/keto reductase
MGTWNLELESRPLAVAALRYGLELGMTHVDTAEMYGAGEVESIVGEAIEGRRHEVFLVSKVLPRNASRRGTIAACEASLRRLRTDHLDCYLLHWRDGTPLFETLAAFEELAQQGKIRSFGVSNLDVADLLEVERLAGSGRLACDQVLYHLRERAVEQAILPWCRAHNVALVAYSPLGAGRFPSRFGVSGRTLHSVAARHDATMRQVALAFLLRDPAVFVIPKAASRFHLDDNARAAALRLTTRDVAELEAAFSSGEPVRESPSP